MRINFFRNVPYIAKSYKTIYFFVCYLCKLPINWLMPYYFSTSSPEKEYLMQFQTNRDHLLSSLSKPSLSIVVGRNSGWESCRSLLYSLCTCGAVEHIKLIHSQGTQRILGAIYAFMGVGFVLIINLFSLVIDSHKAYLLLSWDE